MSKFANIFPGLSASQPSRIMGGGPGTATTAASMPSKPPIEAMTKGQPRTHGPDGLFGNIFGRGNGGILPEKGSEQQRDLVNALVQQGLASAGQSGSPLLALLAPMAGAAISTRANSLYDEAQEGRVSDSYDQFMQATGASPAALELMKLMEDPNLPDAAKSQLSKRLSSLMGGGGSSGGSGGGRRGSPAQVDQKQRLYGEYEINGVLYGRNRYGELVPYTLPDGNPVMSGDDGFTTATETDENLRDIMINGPSMRPPPGQDRAPRPPGPMGDMSDDDLIQKYLG